MIPGITGAPNWSPSPAELYSWFGTWVVIGVLAFAIVATARMLFGVGVGLIDNPPPEPVRRRRTQRFAGGTALNALVLLATYPLIPEAPTEWLNAPMQSPRDLYLAITWPALSFTWIVLTVGTACAVLVLARIATGPFGEAPLPEGGSSATDADSAEKECSHG